MGFFTSIKQTHLRYKKSIAQSQKAVKNALLVFKVVFCMGTKAASCLQFQFSGMIFCNETEDKNYVICSPSLILTCLLSGCFLFWLWVLFLFVFFSEHLL